MAINKMFVMLPMIFLVRKLDSEDPTTVYALRCIYGVVQSIAVCVVLYTYFAASTAAKKYDEVIYVPPPPTPFPDPNAKKKYTEVMYGAHVLSTARLLVGSTLFGICLTLAFHHYKGMMVGLAMQSVMTPLNLFDNALVKAIFRSSGIHPEARIFDEKVAADLTPQDEVVDGAGNPVVRTVKKTGETFEDILLDTWDAGQKADLTELMKALDKKTANYRTKNEGWTPLMILAGLNAKGTASAIRQCEELGGNPAIVDGEGWNALHWAAFHGSPEAAKIFVENASLNVPDKEGKTPLEHAIEEGNDEVAKILEAAKATTTETKADGLRKRK